MKLADHINQRRYNYQRNAEALKALEDRGITIQERSNQAVVVKKRWLIYIFMNTYYDLKTNVRGTFEPGQLDFIKLPGRPKKAA